MTTLIERDWPNLKIEPLQVPEDLRLLIGWTGSPASTSDLVDQVHQSREEKKNSYENFLNESKNCVRSNDPRLQTKRYSFDPKNDSQNRSLLTSLLA